MSKLLNGKVAIVTGGAKGLGYGISRALASEGASVLISGRDGAAAEAVAAEICVTNIAIPAFSFAAKADPALNPNQPTQSMQAPIIASTGL